LITVDHDNGQVGENLSQVRRGVEKSVQDAGAEEEYERLLLAEDLAKRLPEAAKQLAHSWPQRWGSRSTRPIRGNARRPATSAVPASASVGTAEMRSGAPTNT